MSLSIAVKTNHCGLYHDGSNGRICPQSAL